MAKTPVRSFDKNLSRDDGGVTASYSSVISESEDKGAFRLGIGTAFRKNRFKITLNLEDKGKRAEHVFSQIFAGNPTGFKYINAPYEVPSVWRNYNHFINDSTWEWTNQFVAFQCPGYTLSMSGNIVQYSKYPIAGERGALTLDFMNDQWNFARQFWDSYLKRAAYKHVVEFFDNLKFTVKCEIYNNNMRPFITHTFRDCVVIGQGEEEFAWANASANPIVKLDLDYKKHEINYHSEEMWGISRVSSAKDGEIGSDVKSLSDVYAEQIYDMKLYPNNPYMLTIKNTYKTLRTIQNVMAFGSTVLPLVGELGRYLPLGAVATMAIASAIKIGGGLTDGPEIMTAKGPVKASDALFEKSFINPTILAGDLSAAVNSISEGTLVSKQIEYVIAWIRSAVYQGEYLGGINGGAPDKQVVWDLDMKNKFLLAKFFPISGNGGIDTTGRNPMVTTDGITDKDKTNEYNTLLSLRGKDVTGGVLGANKVDPYRAWDISRHKLTRIDYSDTYTGTKNVTKFRTASEINDTFRVYTTIVTNVGSPGANTQVDGVKQTNNPWKKESYGVIPSKVLDKQGNEIPLPTLSQVTFSPSHPIINITLLSKQFADGGIDVFQKVKYGPTSSPIENVIIPSADVADGGISTHKSSTYHSMKIEDIVLLSADKADGGLNSKQKTMYGPKDAQIERIIIPPVDSADGGIGVYQKASYDGPLVNKNLNQPEGSISGFKKDTYGAIVDNSLGMKDIVFLSPADELKLKLQVSSVIDKGLSFWKHNNYGPLNDSTVNAYGNDQEPNPTLGEVLFNTNVPLVNAPLELSDPKVIDAVKASIANIFIGRDLQGKIIVNDLNDPKVAQAAYALFLKSMTDATENTSKNDAKVKGNDVQDNVSKNDASIYMKNVDNVLKNQNTTTRNTTPLTNDSSNKASITIIDHDNTNSVAPMDKSQFDLEKLSEDKKALITKEMSVLRKSIEDTLLRPLGTGVPLDAIQNFNAGRINLSVPKSDEKAPRIPGFNLDGGIKDSVNQSVDPAQYSLSDYVRKGGVNVDKTPYGEKNVKETIASSSVLDAYRKKVGDPGDQNEKGEIGSDLLTMYRRMVDEGYKSKNDGEQTSSKAEPC